MLSGFRAKYYAYACPHNCSNNGVCDKTTGRCVCDPFYGGTDCTVPQCPDSCGNTSNGANNRGQCSETIDSILQGRQNTSASLLNPAYCLCRPGFAGEDCSLDENNFVGNTWHFLARPQVTTSLDNTVIFSSRTSHTSVYDSVRDILYIYGGYDLNQILGDLIAYDFKKGGTWLRYNKARGRFIAASNKPIPQLDPGNTSKETPSDPTFEELKDKTRKLRNHPPPLYGHAMAIVPGGFVIFGGIAAKHGKKQKYSEGQTTNVLWFFSTKNNRWKKVATNSIIKPIAVSKHTLTRADDYLYVFGGSEKYGKFSHVMYKIFCGQKSIENTKHKEGWLDQWKLVKPKGGNDFDLRVTGHSVVYHQRDHKLILFGGIRTDVARFSKLDGLMYSFDLLSETWSKINLYSGKGTDKSQIKSSQFQYSNKASAAYIPPERAFHSANIMGNYMVIFGGYSHRHNEVEYCHDHKLYFFHLGCYVWVSDSILEHSHKASGRFAYPLGVGQGLFGHSAVVRKKNFLVVTGGYNGAVSNAAIAYTFPYALAMINNDKVCTHYGSQISCSSNPECGWCPSDGVCYLRTSTSMCQQSNLQTTSCPGICPTLSNCKSCTLHGNPNLVPNITKPSSKKPGMEGELHNTADILRLRECSWCISEGKCYSTHGSPDLCMAEELTSHIPEETADSIKTGNFVNVKKLTSYKKCLTHDNVHGLTLTQHYNPPNLEYPDYVATVNQSQIVFPPNDKVFVDGLYFTGAIGRSEKYGRYLSRLRGSIRIPKTRVDDSDWMNETRLMLCLENVLRDSEIELSLSQSASGPLMSVLNTSSLHSSSSLTECGIPLKWPNENTSNTHLEAPKELLISDNVKADINHEDSGNIILRPGSEYKLELKVIRNITTMYKSSKVWSKVSLVRRRNVSGKQNSNVKLKNNLLLQSMYLKPYQYDGQANGNFKCKSIYSNCLACTSDLKCGWDEVKFSCVDRQERSEQIMNLEQDQKYLGLLKLYPFECVSCEKHIYCDTCVAEKDGSCEWLEDLQKDEARCVRKGRFKPETLFTSPIKVIGNYTECPIPCHARKSCSSCVGDAGKCVWCKETQECFLFSVYTSHYMYGRCNQWIDKDRTFTLSLDLVSQENSGNDKKIFNIEENSKKTDEKRKHETFEFKRGDSNLIGTSSQCVDCNLFRNCSVCLSNLNCGWCYTVSNPTIGKCIKGGFDRPANQKECAHLPNGEVTERKMWAYGRCPDINECDLGRHNCHPNATCSNLDPGKFECRCNKGFVGLGIGHVDEKTENMDGILTDGFKNETSIQGIEDYNLLQGCHRTCFEDCIHGECSHGPEYRCLCSLGWTGSDCSIDCGCNGHSTCNNVNNTNAYIADEPGSKSHPKCDRCLNNTSGDNCEFCVNGSYGNATDKETGCKPCDCNGHGDVSKGICNQKTGFCYCNDNTEGSKCQHCKAGFFGNPSNGKNCYRQCQPKQFISTSLEKINKGYLGSYSSHSHKLDTFRKLLKIDQSLNLSVPAEYEKKLLSGLHTWQECMWIISSLKLKSRSPDLKDINNISTLLDLYNFNSSIHRSSHPSIRLEIESISSNANVSSYGASEAYQSNHIYVYDGLPKFISTESILNSKLIAAFSNLYSSSNFSRSAVEARSGIMTVYYIDDGNGGGFNASYEILQCPNSCRKGNRECVKKNYGTDGVGTDACVCKKGWTGNDCKVPLCSTGCSGNIDKEGCNFKKRPCLCKTEFDRKKCSSGLNDSKIQIGSLLGHISPAKLKNVIEIKKAYAKLLPRFGHTLEVDTQTGLIWIFGGYSNSFNAPLNDIRAFDTRKEVWVPITVQVSTSTNSEQRQNPNQDTVVSPQFNFKMKPMKQGKYSGRLKGLKILHHATRFKRRYRRWLASIPRISLLSSSFTPKKSSNRHKPLGPPERYFHASALVTTDNSLFIHGGMNKTEYLSDFWRFDVIHRTWQKLESLWDSQCCVGGAQLEIEKEVKYINIFQ